MSVERARLLRSLWARGQGSGVVLWRGPSWLNGAPVVVVATGTARPSGNKKTGAMVQTWVLPVELGPVEAARTGADAAVCGSCPHRPLLAKESGVDPCYVTLVHGPRAVWEAWNRGSYLDVSRWGEDAWAELFTGARIRMGSWGDPAAAPVEVWSALALRAEFWTGYTHQWKHLDGLWPLLLMASVDSELERDWARGLGWRTFRIGDEVERGEVLCPASEEAGRRATCDACGLCAGAWSELKGESVKGQIAPSSASWRVRDVVIPAHGGHKRRRSLAVV